MFNSVACQKHGISLHLQCIGRAALSRFQHLLIYYHTISGVFEKGFKLRKDCQQNSHQASAVSRDREVAPTAKSLPLRALLHALFNLAECHTCLAELTL